MGDRVTRPRASRPAKNRAAAGDEPAWLPLSTSRFLAEPELRRRLHTLLNVHASVAGVAGLMAAADILAPMIGVTPERLEVLFTLSLAIRDAEVRGFALDLAEFEVGLYMLPRVTRAESAIAAYRRIHEALQTTQAESTPLIEQLNAAPAVH